MITMYLLMRNKLSEKWLKGHISLTEVCRTCKVTGD